MKAETESVPAIFDLVKLSGFSIIKLFGKDNLNGNLPVDRQTLKWCKKAIKINVSEIINTNDGSKRCVNIF